MQGRTIHRQAGPLANGHTPVCLIDVSALFQRKVGVLLVGWRAAGFADTTFDGSHQRLAAHAVSTPGDVRVRP